MPQRAKLLGNGASHAAGPCGVRSLFHRRGDAASLAAVLGTLTRLALSVVRRLLLSCACLTVCALPRASQAEDGWQRSRTSKAEALLVGSSSINHSLGRIIERELAHLGYRVTRKGVPAAGLARPDYRDMSEILETLPISKRTAAVFVYVGMNDAQALWLRPHERQDPNHSFVAWNDQRWDQLYAQRAREFFERICQRGAQRALVLLPVDVERERLQSRLSRIRALQAEAASDSSCAVALSTTGDVGRFEVRGVAMRRPDGFHMSPKGAEVVWERIQDTALRLVRVPTAREEHGLWCGAPRCG